MNDQEMLRLLPDYLAGRLDETIWLQISQRLETSADLRKALEAATLYRDAVAAIDPIRAPENFLDNVHRRIESRNGLFDRLFRPFHIKLPIEFAGVAVTVMLVVLLYNPFSGRVPRSAVEQQRLYTELQELPAAVENAAPVASRPVAPVPMEPSVADVAQKKSLRRSYTGNEAVEDETAKLKEAASVSYASTSTGRAANEAPGGAAYQSTATGQPPVQQSPSMTPASRHEDVSTDAVAAGAALSAPVAPAEPPPPSPADVPTKAAYRAPAAEYERSADDGNEQALRYSSGARAQARTAPESRTARPSVAKREMVAASTSEMKTRLSPTDIATAQIKDIAGRFHGTIDTDFSARNDTIRLRLTIPVKKFGAFKKTLTEDVTSASIVDTSTVSGRNDLMIILEIQP